MPAQTELFFGENDIRGDTENRSGVAFDPEKKTRWFSNEVKAVFDTIRGATRTVNTFNLFVQGKLVIDGDQNADFQKLAIDGTDRILTGGKFQPDSQIEYLDSARVSDIVTNRPAGAGANTALRFTNTVAMDPTDTLLRIFNGVTETYNFGADHIITSIDGLSDFELGPTRLKIRRKVSGNDVAIELDPDFLFLEDSNSGTFVVLESGGLDICDGVNDVFLEALGLSFNFVRVVTVQQAAVGNATSGLDIVAQFNTLLSRLRTHGLIAP